jgi:hypothetical protein
VPAAFITIDNIWSSVADTLSVTLIVNVAVPAVVGVPDITPVPDARDSPPGNPPDTIDHAYGVVPAVADTVCEYALDTVPDTNEVVVILNEAIGLMVIDNAWSSVALAESVTRTVKFTVVGFNPMSPGVPVIAPALDRDNPLGSSPEVTA